MIWSSDPAYKHRDEKAHLACTCIEPLLGVGLSDPAADLQALAPRSERLCSRGIVIGSELDDVPACQVVLLVQLGIERGWLSVVSDSPSLGSEPKSARSVLLQVTLHGRVTNITHAATKFVFRFLSSPASDRVRSRVPPTICLTTPSCRSIHGLNWLWRREEDVVWAEVMLQDGGEKPRHGWNCGISSRMGPFVRLLQRM